MRHIVLVVAILTGACLVSHAYAQPVAQNGPVPAPDITADTVVYTREQALKMKGKNLTPRAFNDGIEAVVELTCQIGEKGYPSRCVVTKEEPAGYGFGKASAIALLLKGRVNAEDAGGLWIRQTMRWTFD